MRYERFVVGMDEANGYVVYDDSSREALVIDPGDDAQSFLRFLQKKSLTLKGIVITHFHCDHIGAVEELKKKVPCPVYIHKKDAVGLNDPKFNRSKERFRRAIAFAPDVLLSDGQTLQVGATTLKVINTPGHTPGSICLEVKDGKEIFTGDTLFEDDLGRTDLPGGDVQALRKTAVGKIAQWSDEVIIYPGHGDPVTMAEVWRRNSVLQGMVRKK